MVRDTWLNGTLRKILQSCILISLTAFILSGCAGQEQEAEKQETAIESAQEEQEAEEPETVIESVQAEEQEVAEIGGAEDILLEEVPELGYAYIPIAGGDTYICYKDILILEDDVYHYENGNYIKTDETLRDMLGIEDNYPYYYRQYKNLIVSCNGKCFILYDMDTNKSFNYLVQDDSGSFDILNWYLYDGYLYYRLFPLDEIRRIHLSDGEEEVIYSGKKDDMGIRQFAMRSDGKILCEWCSTSKREYYLIEPCDNGEWKEEKIWETGDRWKYVEWYAFNQYGLFQITEFRHYESRLEGSMLMGEDVIIRENGTVENFDLDRNVARTLYLDTGYLRCIPYSEEMLDKDSTHLLGMRVSGVIFYDYAGNVQSTHQLVEPRILQDGYHMRKLMYHDGKITALYTQEDTGKLYIAQVEVEGMENDTEKVKADAENTEDNTAASKMGEESK